MSWPPPDPDRIPRKTQPVIAGDPFTIPHFNSAADEIAAFRRRQEEDMARRGVGFNNSGEFRRRRKFHDRYKDTKPDQSQTHTELKEDEEEEAEGDSAEEDWENGPVESNRDIDVDEGEEAWRNAEGERLDDFGVDEDVEFYDEEDVPLSVLRERIQAGL